MALLPQVRWDDIRYVLDPGVDEVAIPDQIISSDMYLGAAERWALGVDPAAASRTGTEKDALHRAIVLRVAGLLSPGFPQARQVNMAGHNVTLTYAETASQRTERLLQTAYEEISSYLEIAPTLVDAPIFVTTVAGRRA